MCTIEKHIGRKQFSENNIFSQCVWYRIDQMTFFQSCRQLGRRTILVVNTTISWLKAMALRRPAFSHLNRTMGFLLKRKSTQFYNKKAQAAQTNLTKKTMRFFLKTTSKAMGRPRMAAKGQLKKVDKAVEKMASARLWFNLATKETFIQLNINEARLGFHKKLGGLVKSGNNFVTEEQNISSLKKFTAFCNSQFNFKHYLAAQPSLTCTEQSSCRKKSQRSDELVVQCSLKSSQPLIDAGTSRSVLTKLRGTRGRGTWTWWKASRPFR